MAKDKNYYEQLGVGREASVNDIRKAYYAKARIFHPDKGGELSTLAFQELQTAYETLNDPIKRVAYNTQLLEKAIDADRMRYEPCDLYRGEPIHLDESVLLEDPTAYDYYTYCNKLLRLAGGERIEPHTVFDEEKIREFSKKTDYAIICVDRITDKAEKTSKQAFKQALVCKDMHRKKIYQLQDIIFKSSNPSEISRELYNISLGYYSKPEYEAIPYLLGGMDILREAIRQEARKNFFSDLNFLLLSLHYSKLNV